MRSEAFDDLRAAIIRRDGPCLVARLDPHAGPCRGRTELDHVKERGEPGMAYKEDRAA